MHDKEQHTKQSNMSKTECGSTLPDVHGCLLHEITQQQAGLAQPSKQQDAGIRVACDPAAT
jgi:hypothetical protein